MAKQRQKLSYIFIDPNRKEDLENALKIIITERLVCIHNHPNR